ncbi:hypothetical protein GGR54DRAFT_238005 [Hypoxylon sp. NC1633]|nr:hypothetical protein GGR54DRAFT_238005 [Hypoxylon sp. NC1633]
MTHRQLSFPHCNEIKENALLPGCLGNHIPIVTRALDIIGQRYSLPEMIHIYTDVQLENEVQHNTPLQIAACAGHLSIVQILIDAGAMIDHISQYYSYGRPVLLEALYNEAEVVKELLKADATIIDPLGRWNALDEACNLRNPNPTIIELLLEKVPDELDLPASTSALPKSSGENLALVGVKLHETIQTT